MVYRNQNLVVAALVHHLINNLQRPYFVDALYRRLVQANLVQYAGKAR